MRSSLFSSSSSSPAAATALVVAAILRCHPTLALPLFPSTSSSSMSYRHRHDPHLRRVQRPAPGRTSGTTTNAMTPPTAPCRPIPRPQYGVVGNDMDGTTDRNRDEGEDDDVVVGGGGAGRDEEDSRKERGKKKHDASNNPLAMAYRLYVDYLSRLWSETDVGHRKRLARKRARDAISNVRDLVGGGGTGMMGSGGGCTGGGDGGDGGGGEGEEIGEEGAIFAHLDADVRRKMMEACALVLEQLDRGADDDDGVDGGGERKGTSRGAATTPSSSHTPSTPGTVLPVASVGGTTAAANPSLLPLPVVNERGDLVFPPAYATTTASASASPTSSSSSRALGRSVVGIVPPSPPSSSSSDADETELTEALIADAVSDAMTTTTTPIGGIMGQKKKKGRSVLFGASMGLVVAMWVYSGNYVFTALFTLMTALGQLEYYRTVMAKGIYPARRISVVGACAMFVTASFAPDLHQICLPVASTWAMIWFLTMRRSVSTISEIATTFTGMFYLGESVSLFPSPCFSFVRSADALLTFDVAPPTDESTLAFSRTRILGYIPSFWVR
jgi:hypothetical protein